jgi:hypothetical protein
MTESEVRKYIDRAITLNTETDLVEFKEATGVFQKNQ